MAIFDDAEKEELIQWIISHSAEIYQQEHADRIRLGPEPIPRSYQETGVHVQAWIWVSKTEIEDSLNSLALARTLGDDSAPESAEVVSIADYLAKKSTPTT